MSTPTIYRKIPSHFKNHYPGTSYAFMSQQLSDALDVAGAIMGVKPSQMIFYQGSWNDNGPLNSAGAHGKANAADFDLHATAKATGTSINTWIKTLSYVGIAGWVRDSSHAHGHMLPVHYHLFCLYQRNAKYVDDIIIGQQGSYLHNGTGLVRGGVDYHAHLRPDIRSVHFMGKAKSRAAVITKDTHSYTQPGKHAIHQAAVRARGYKLTNCAGIVRVWEGDKSTDMVVTEGLRFYDLAKVKF